MAIESSAKFISELNEAYPRNRDFIKEGDDHLRLVKSVIKTTFPFIDSEIRLPSSKLNRLDRSLTYDDSDVLTISSNLTIEENLSLNAGGNRLENLGDPKEEQDIITVSYLQTKGIWPVGSIFISADSRNPSESLGFGTWVPFASGRIVVGTGSHSDGSGDLLTFANEASGGSYGHRLSTKEIPKHSHRISNAQTSVSGNHNHDVITYGAQYGVNHPTDHVNFYGCTFTETEYLGIHGGNVLEDGNHTHNLSGGVSVSGKGETHNNVQPYMVCHFWKRTA